MSGDDGYESTMDFTVSSEHDDNDRKTSENHSVNQNAQNDVKEISQILHSTSGGNESEMETDHEELDPRVKGKLEELNQLTVKINDLEKKFEESNHTFRSYLSDSSDKLRQLAAKVGTKSVSEARPYHEARERIREAQLATQKAAAEFERASALHATAKDTVRKTEEKFENRHRDPVDSTPGSGSNSSKELKFDSRWQTMLNEATMKLMEAELKKKRSEEEHLEAMRRFREAEFALHQIERQHQSAIKKSMPYFDQAAKFQYNLNEMKSQIGQLSKFITETKEKYAATLKELEGISEEIHERRNQAAKLPREPGVGAELESILPAEVNLAAASRPSASNHSDNAETPLSPS